MLVVGFLLGPIGHLAEIVCGVVALTRGEDKKVLAVIGLLFNALFLLIAALLIAFVAWVDKVAV